MTYKKLFLLVMMLLTLTNTKAGSLDDIRQALEQSSQEQVQSIHALLKESRDDFVFLHEKRGLCHDDQFHLGAREDAIALQR